MFQSSNCVTLFIVWSLNEIVVTVVFRNPPRIRNCVTNM